MDNLLDNIRIWTKNRYVGEIIVFAILVVIIETMAQNTLKIGENKGKIIIGLSLYATMGYILYYVYKRFPLSKFNVIWSSFSIVFATIFGYILYNEGINGLKILSVILALGAVFSSYMAE